MLLTSVRTEPEYCVGAIIKPLPKGLSQIVTVSSCSERVLLRCIYVELEPIEIMS